MEKIDYGTWITFLTDITDQRIPGYIEGYVRRFWQVGLTCLHSYWDSIFLPSMVPSDANLWQYLRTKNRELISSSCYNLFPGEVGMIECSVKPFLIFLLSQTFPGQEPL